MADKLNWTEIFEDTDYPVVLDMAPIEYTGREEFDVDATEEEIANATILFMNVM